jgi:cytochrome c oxidase subunit 2
LRPDVTAANSRRRRSRLVPLRILTLALAVAALASLILAPGALANFITPKSGGSKNANEIASLYRIILYIAAVVFVIVEGALTYSVIKFRASRGARAAQIHGNTRLEIGWTIAAALILVVITVVTFAKLPSIIHPPSTNAGVQLSADTTQPTVPKGNKLTICVQGRQFIWRYTYGNNCLNNSYAAQLPYSFTDMYVPAGVSIILDIQANDVIHSWWIPSLGGKVDAVPGYTTYTWFKADKASTPGHPVIYHGQCAQLCGRGHAAMVATVHVLSPSDYRQWALQQERLIRKANAQVTQLRQQLTSNGNL